MSESNARPRPPWLLIWLIAWSTLDIAVHVAVDMVEPLRIAGNVVAAAAALAVLLRLAGPYAPHVLSLAAALVLGLNVAESLLHGYLPPMQIFVGVTVLLLLSARAEAVRADTRPKAQRHPWHLRWWASLAATLVDVGVIALVGQPTSLDPLAQLHDGRLVAADYWSDEPMILSAGMGFENIIGLPEVNEDSVREAGGSWYGSLVCTNGAAPQITSYTSTAPSEGVARLYKKGSRSTTPGSRSPSAGPGRPRRWTSRTSGSRSTPATSISRTAGGCGPTGS